MTPADQKVLSALSDAHTEWADFVFLSFATICYRTGLDRRTVRLSCRRLTRKGYAEYGRGLWTQCGDMAGSGYAATQAGCDLVRKLEEDV